MKSEANLQQQMVIWFNNKYCLKHHEPRGLIFAVPNGGSRNKIEAMILRATGVLSGVSDLIMILPNGRLIFVEVKFQNGKQSESQKDFENRVKKLGFEYWLINDLQAFKDSVLKT